MRFNLIVSIIGTTIFAATVAGVYALTDGFTAFAATWVLKVIIGSINIAIGKAKNRSDHRRDHAARFEPVTDMA